MSPEQFTKPSTLCDAGAHLSHIHMRCEAAIEKNEVVDFYIKKLLLRVGEVDQLIKC